MQRVISSSLDQNEQINWNQRLCLFETFHSVYGAYVVAPGALAMFQHVESKMLINYHIFTPMQIHVIDIIAAIYLFAKQTQINFLANPQAFYLFDV